MMALPPQSGTIATPESMGAIGDGVKDDSAAINALSLLISRKGGGLIRFNPDKRYYIARSIVIYPGVSMQGQGATLQTDRNIYFMIVPNPSFDGNAYETSYTSLGAQNPQRILAMSEVTAAPAARTNIITLAKTNGFSVDDPICVRLGQNPTDAPEARIQLMTKITAMNGNDISISEPIPIDTNLIGVNVQNAMVYKYKYQVQGVSVGGFNFECLNGADIEGGLWLEWCQNIALSDLTANRFGGLNMGAGILTAVRASGIRGQNIRAYRNANTTGQTSKGRLIGIGASKSCIFENLTADHCQSFIAVIEGYSQDVELKNVVYRDESASSTKTLFLALQGSEYAVDGLSIHSNSNIAVDGNGGTYAFGTIKNVNVETVGGKFPVIGATASYKGYYRFSDGTNQFELDFDDLRVHEMKIQLHANMSEYFSFPKGIVVDMSAYASPDCFGITALFKGTLDNGADRTYLVSPGHWESEVFHDRFALLGFDPYLNYAAATEPTKILLRTGPKATGSLSLKVSITPFKAIDHMSILSPTDTTAP